MLPVGGIAEKVLAAHRGGLRRVLLPRRNRKQVDEDLGDDLRHIVAIDFATRVDELLERPCSPRRLWAAWRRSRRQAAHPEPAERQPARCGEDEQPAA